MIKRIQHSFLNASTADVIAFVGLLGYALLSFFFAHTTRPILDEGLYTYKGWLFVSGRYTPYQDYGPWMNHMPLSFLIPGAAQVMFGPGLRTGRYFAIFLGIMMLVGVYFTARRLGGKWTAAVVVLAFALNFSTIETYSVAISQGVVACVLAWILFLSLGDDRSQWQIVLAGFLAALLVLIRINMFPILILLVLYIWWENGWTKSRWVIAVAFLSFVGLHAIFWPGILQNWLKWLPVSTDLETFLTPDPTGSKKLNEALNFSYAHLDSLFFTIRSHFIPIVGAITTWLLWPDRKQWGEQTYFRIAVFLSVTFVVMFLAHSWASLGQSYCVLCLPVYTAFFQTLGIFLIVVSWKYWKKKNRFGSQILAVLFIVIVFVGVAYSLNETLDVQPNEMIQSVLRLAQNPSQFPTGLKGQFLHILSNIFVIQNERDVVSLSKRLSLSFYGAVAGVLFLLFTGILLQMRKSSSKYKVSFGSLALHSFLLIGFILLPTNLLSNNSSFQCREDQISNFENLGDELAYKIPNDSQIYWLGYSPSLLLYLPNVKIFPPQLNGYNTFSTAANSNELYREGRWNNDSAELWASEATHIILTQLVYESADLVVEKYVKTGLYSEIPLDTTSFYTCDETDQLEIRLFKRDE